MIEAGAALPMLALENIEQIADALEISTYFSINASNARSALALLLACQISWIAYFALG